MRSLNLVLPKISSLRCLTLLILLFTLSPSAFPEDFQTTSLASAWHRTTVDDSTTLFTNGKQAIVTSVYKIHGEHEPSSDEVFSAASDIAWVRAQNLARFGVADY